MSYDFGYSLDRWQSLSLGESPCKSPKAASHSSSAMPSTVFTANDRAILVVLAAAVYKHRTGQLNVLDTMTGCGIRALQYAIADLYGRDCMDSEFPLIREAHDIPKESLCEHNDETIERIYMGCRFKNDTDRVALRSKSAQKLFELYTKMTDRLATPKKTTNRKLKEGNHENRNRATDGENGSVLSKMAAHRTRSIWLRFAR